MLKPQQFCFHTTIDYGCHGQYHFQLSSHACTQISSAVKLILNTCHWEPTFCPQIGLTVYPVGIEYVIELLSTKRLHFQSFLSLYAGRESLVEPLQKLFYQSIWLLQLRDYPYYECIDEKNSCSGG